jgi:PAS domain S-box-containing protein
VEDEGWRVRKDGSRFWADIVITALRDEAGNLRGFTKVTRDITDRKRAEEERDRFFNLSMDMLSVSGTDAYFKRLNPAFEQVLGYTNEELLAQPFLDFVHPDDRAATLAEVAKLAHGNLTLDFENRYRCKDGSYRWISWKAFPIVEENLIYAIARDVTERKQAEVERLQLLAQEQQARAEAEAARNQSVNILESITDAFFALDQDWRFTYLNRQAELLMQRKREELLGQVMWDEFPEAVGSTFDLEYHRAVWEQVSVEFEAFYPPLNIWFEVHAYPAREGLSVYFRNINDRKQAQRTLQETLTLQRAILDSANYTIISTTVDGTIRTFNAAAERSLGYAAEEVVGKTTPALIHDWNEIVQRAQELSQELGETIEPGFEVFVAKARGGAVDENEWSYIRKDGSRFPVLLSVTALRDAENNITGFLGIGSDITERKQALEAIRKSSEEIHDLYNNAPCGYHSIDGNGTFVRINDTELKWLGYTRDEVIGKKKFSDFLTAESIRTFEENFPRFKERGWLRELEFQLLRKDGTSLPVLLNATAIRDASGRFVMSRSTLFDISDRKRTEAALRESEERFHQAFENAAIGMALVSLDGHWLQVNRSLCEMLGYSEQELLATTFQAVTHPDDLEIGLNYLQQMISGEIDSCQIEKRYLHKLGHIVWVMLSSSIIRDRRNQPLYCVTQIEDISEAKRLDAERKQAEEELRNLSKALESAVEGIAQLDTQGRYIKTNPAYASILGYQPEELVGRNWQQTIYPDELETIETAYQRMLIDGKAEFEARAVRKDGTVFDKQVVMVKAYNQQQQFIGNYCFMKDVSDRREIERLKDEFISVVSHELRTPLTSISAALDLLAGGVLQNQPEEAQHMLSIAANNTDRLVRLINDILDIERIESGKIIMTKQACDAADLMNQSVEAIQEIAERAGVALSVSPVSIRLWADPDRIIQVLTNLLSNAIKFSPQGSTIWLSAELIKTQESGVRGQESETLYPSSPCDTLLIKVRDQGRGIPSDKLESIFERFQQVDASDSRQKGGTGLGLAICRSILQQHEGQIWAESTLGEGSTFCFTLPVLPDFETSEFVPPDGGSASLTVLSSEFEDSTQSSPVVLVCDDDSSVRTVLQAMLKREGYRVMTAASGHEAVERAVAQPPDVILLNLMMPQMDGWETLAVLKNQTETQTIPVIILSGLLPDAREAPHPGISDWIVKPPEPKVLRQALERVLADRNQTIKVLIVEDDLELAQVLATMLSRHGIETFHTQTGREAIQVSQRIIPDLLVLDLALPEYNGFAVVDWLRQHNRLCQVPLVVYTAQDLDESDRERLKLGQTLFFTKGRITSQEFEQRAIDLLNRMIRGKTREPS